MRPFSVNTGRDLLPKAKINLFMNDELIRAENLSLSKEMAANRIFALDEILNDKNEMLKTRYYYYLTIINNGLKTISDSPWTFDQAITYIKSNRKSK